ncbi:hypothetical protein B0H14DRAFT_2585344 [Mycena olivaceomarginata]|nr:hypothetical protein B0H14DRAFT_2585344 [Mycena olivaceomarginata]
MLVEIDAERMLWVRPPNIADVTSGAWSYFREKTEITESGKDETYMLKLGKANSEKRVDEGESLWYDRMMNQRKLIFESIPPLDEGEWLTTEEEYSATNKSLWMYLRERPSPGLKGQEPPIPENKDLPMKNSDGTREPFQDVKGAWARQDGNDTDAVVNGKPLPRRPRAAPAPMEGRPPLDLEEGLLSPDESLPLPLPCPLGIQADSGLSCLARTDLDQIRGGWTLRRAEVLIGEVFPMRREHDRVTAGWPAEALGWGRGRGRPYERQGWGSQGLPPRRDELFSPRLEQRPPPNAPRGPNLPPQRWPPARPLISDPPPGTTVLILPLPVYPAPRSYPLGFAKSCSRPTPFAVDNFPTVPISGVEYIASRISGPLREIETKTKTLDFLFVLQDKTSAAKTKVRVELFVFKLKVALLLPLSLQLPLSLPFPNPFQTLTQVSPLAAPPYPEVALETPKGSSFLFEGGSDAEIALAFAGRCWTRGSATARTNDGGNPSSKRRPLLDRFNDVADVEMPMASVYQRFDVPLEERIGEGKKHRFHKHNRTKKRERKEAERRAKEDEERQEWETQRKGGGYEQYPPRSFLFLNKRHVRTGGLCDGLLASRADD